MTPPKALQKIWWFDLVYPTVLAVILFGSLTAVVYGGKPSSRLSSLAEGKLLEWALHEARVAHVEDAPDVLAVNAEPTDMTRFRPAPLGHVPDLSAAEYARAVRILAEAGVPYVYVSWDLSAHPNDEIYYLPLIEVARHYKGRTELAFVVSLERATDFPRALAENARVLSDQSCLARDDLSTYCLYMEGGTSDWIVQNLMDATGATALAKEPDGSLARWLTLKLPVNLPAYAMSVPPPSAVRQLSFTDLAAHGTAALAGTPPRFAFIGADVRGATSGSTESRFVRTIHDEERGSIDASGTPFHLYWAQVARMFHDRTMLHFPADWADVPATFALCLVILGVLIRFGGVAAAGVVFAYAVAGFGADVYLGIPRGFYLPLFDSLYFGFATLIFASAGRVSLLAYQRWQLQERQRLHAKTADLKANFVSLVSHNLNTPVAKMQGMIGIVQSLTKDPEAASRLARAMRLVTRLELTIRFVLTAAALDEGKVNEQPRSLDMALKEFQGSAGPTLKRLGVDLALTLDGADDSDALHVPMPVDVRVLAAVLTALAARYAPTAGAPSPTRWLVTATDEDDGRVTLTVLARGSTQPAAAMRAGDFFHEMATGLLDRMAARHDGVFEVSGQGAETARLTLTFGRGRGAGASLA